MLKFAVCFLGVLLFSCPVSADSFIAKVNRNPVPLGETFVLTLQYDGNPGTAEPDLEPLNKDFTIYSVGREQQHRSINGQQSFSYRWNVIMAPKVGGTVVIPSIAFRNLSSKPITLKVAEETAGGTNVPKFSIGRFVNPRQPLVQEQMIYTLVLKTTEEIQGSMPQFGDAGSDWIVKQLDEPSVSSEIDNGIEVHKIEIRYAMFPQKSGKLKVPELNFNGYYVNKNKLRSDPFGGMFNTFVDESFYSGFGATRAMNRINLTAQPLEVDVSPIPADNNGYWWLPSTVVHISSDWEEGEIPTFKAGEAVNRKITLAAAGVADTQLPKLDFKEVTGLKQYPEKPEISSAAVGGGIISSMTVNVVYIPEHGGQMTIPEIMVPWYNVTTRQMEKAILPAITVQVEGSAPTVSSPVKKEMEAMSDEKSGTVVEKLPSETSSPLPLQAVIGFAVLAFAAGLGIGWLVLRSRCMMELPQPEKNKSRPQSSLKEALRSGDLKNVRDQILVWAKTIYPETVIRNLDDVAMLFGNEELSLCLKQLGSAMYSGKKDDFDIEKLEKITTVLSAVKKNGREETAPLPNLYK